MFWEILEIEATKDITAIQAAYREKLRVTNPEDDPQGFMRLRQALEDALKYAKESETEATEETEDIMRDRYADESPVSENDKKVTQWLSDIDELYNTFSRRRLPEEWEKAFNDDVLRDPKTEHMAVRELLEYITEHFYFSGRVRQTIRDGLDLEKREKQLREVFNDKFMDYMLKDAEEYEYPAYDYFEGSDDMPFDHYIELSFDLKRLLGNHETRKAHEIIEEMEATGIKNPFINIEKASVCCQEENYDEAEKYINRLLPEYEHNLNVILTQADIALLKGEFDKAKALFSRGLDIVPDNMHAGYGLGRSMTELGEYKGAREVLKKLQDESPYDAHILEAIAECNEKYLVYLQERVASGENNSKLFFELMRLLAENERYDEAVEFLDVLESYKEKFRDFDKLAAVIYFNTENDRKALEYTAKCDDEACRIMESIIFSRSDEPLKGISILDSVLEKDPHSRAALLQKAQQLYYIFDDKGCINVASELIELEPEYNLPYVLRAKSFFGLGMYDDALDDCETAIELYKYELDAHFYKIKTLAKIGEFEAAEDWLEWMRGEGLGGSELDFLEGIISEEAGELEKAEKIYHNIIRKHGTEKEEEGRTILIKDDLEEIYYHLAMLEYDDELEAYEYEDGVADHIDELVDKGLEFNDSYIPLLEIKGNLDYLFDYYESAAVSYKKAIAAAPGKVDLYRALATIYSADMKWEDALEILDMAIERDPSAYDYCTRSEILMRLGQLDEAMESLTTAFSLKSEFPEAMNNMGKVMEHKGDDDVALEYYLGAIAMGEEYDDICQEAYIMAAALYRRRRAFVQAIEMLNKAYEKTADTEILCKVAQTCCDAGIMDAAREAVTMYRKEENLGRLSFRYNWEMAAIYKAAKNFDRAFDLYDMISVDDSAAGLEAGKLLYYRGKPKKALKYFKKAVKMLDEEREIDEDAFAAAYYYLWAAKASIAARDKKSAIMYAEKGLQQIPENYAEMYNGWLPQLNCIISGLYAVKGEMGVAESLLKDTLLLVKCEGCTNQCCIDALSQLGYLYELQGRPEDAEACYNKGLDAAPKNRDMYCALMHLKGKKIWL